MLCCLAWFVANLLFAAARESAEMGSKRVVLEMEVPLPTNWQLSDTPPSAEIELTFAVKQSGLRELHDALMRVSTPSSPDYGRHLSNEEVQNMTAPAPHHVEVVTAFLRAHGVEPHAATPNQDFIAASVPVDVAEKMLSTKYVRLLHSSGAEITRAPTGYSLPAEVAAAVDFVGPTVHIPGVHRPRAPKSLHGTANESGFGFNSPKNLRSLYSIGAAEGKASANKMAVTAFLEQGYGKGSLHRFWGQFCSGITCGKGEPKLVGDATAGSAGVESMLDIETITGVAGNVEAEFWGFSGRSPDNKQNEPFLKWLTQLSSTGDGDVPKIFSTSYGEDEGSWSYPASQRLNVEFQKAGARGISLLYAAGDEGANCKDQKFVPEGPGSSPYVTAVGGTAPGSSWPKAGPDSETAIGLSSGGFSNYWPMPAYQKKAVQKYLQQSGLPPASLGYNISGRAYPDISAQATNYFVWAGFPVPGVSGTSCASPAAAGVFALLNDIRMQSGKSSLGFLNPLIYENQDSFNDITTGSSSGCFGGSGWPAKQGWDAVTGVGTPNYSKLAKAMDSLPAGNAPGGGNTLNAAKQSFIV